MACSFPLYKNSLKLFPVAQVRGFRENTFFRNGGVAVVFIYLYGYRINLEKELALYLYALCESLKSYMIKSKYIKL